MEQVPPWLQHGLLLWRRCGGYRLIVGVIFAGHAAAGGVGNGAAGSALQEIRPAAAAVPEGGHPGGAHMGLSIAFEGSQKRFTGR